MEKNYIILDENRVVVNSIIIDPETFDPNTLGAIENIYGASMSDQIDDNGNIVSREVLYVGGGSLDSPPTPLTLDEINQIIASIENEDAPVTIT
jgi:hypothetical protein